MGGYHMALRVAIILALAVLASAAPPLEDRDFVCGVRDTHSHLEHLHRSKRSTADNEASVTADHKTIELGIVCDTLCYNNVISRGYPDVEVFLYDLVKGASKRMAPLSTDVVLSQMVIWTQQDEFVVSNNADVLLEDMKMYRTAVLLPRQWTDATFLVTGQAMYQTGGEIDGLFGVGTIGSGNAAGLLAYTTARTDKLSLIIAHELGHGIGMSHDASSCECDYGSGNCVMNAISNSVQMNYFAWSSCSYEKFALYLPQQHLQSLMNPPRHVYTPANANKCGNGVVDEGEECDCAGGCVFNCCGCCTDQCQFTSNAECATGDCCNTATCKLQQSRYRCRDSRDATCDQAGYCTGDSSECPDSYTADGTDCSTAGEASYCMAGSCLSRTTQCKNFWNDGYSNGDDACYEDGVHASSYANCGMVPQGRSRYTSCSMDGDPYYMCGKLQCTGAKNDILFMATSFYRDPKQNPGVSPEICRAVNYAPWEWPDTGPVYVANGTKCGTGKACLGMDCMDKDTVYELLASEIKRTAVCGNGIVEEGEQCDCGGMFQDCTCCDENTCQFYKRDATCRFNDCGRCTGRHPTCKRNQRRGTPCDNNRGGCFRGECKSMTQQCHRYYDDNAVPAVDVMEFNAKFNTTQWNGGGYLLKDLSTNAWASESVFAPAQGDGTCGLLLCNTTKSAKVYVDGNKVDSTTFFLQPSFFSGTRCAFYASEVVRNFTERYTKYLPVMVDHGTPCAIGGQTGYCRTNKIQMDSRKWTWYLRARCIV